MKPLNPYLTFNGNCREAMAFYQQCLGGNLTLQTVGDSPMADQMPQQMKDCILHSALANDSLTIMATDLCPENGLVKGNSVSLLLNCSSEEEARSLYEKLASGGEATHPMENTFWGALLGDLTDRFGNHWMVNLDKNQN